MSIREFLPVLGCLTSQTLQHKAGLCSKLSCKKWTCLTHLAASSCINLKGKSAWTHLVWTDCRFYCHLPELAWTQVSVREVWPWKHPSHSCQTCPGLLPWGKELKHPLREGSPDTATNRKEDSPWGTSTLFCPPFNPVLLCSLPTSLPGKPFSSGKCPSDVETVCNIPALSENLGLVGFFTAGLSGRVVTQIISACMSEKSAWHLPLAGVALWLDFYPARQLGPT